jgi:hypothetical protein
VECITWALDRPHWAAGVNTVMKVRVTLKAGTVFTR